MRFSTSRLLGGSLAIAALAAGAFASVTAAPSRLPANPVRVSVQSLGQDRVEVVLTNTSRKTLRIPKWQLPSAAADSNLFRISREGEKVRFHGRMIKRAAPTMAEFAVLRPGQAHRSVVELGRMYDLSKPGLYTVTYATALQYASLSGGLHLRAGNGAPLVAQAAPIRISLDRAVAAGNRIKPVLPANPTLSDVVGISTVSCSSTQISQLNQAVLSARSYSENSKGYLNGGATGARYTSWFGAYTSDRYATVKQHFGAKDRIDDALDQTGGQVTINCGCNEGYFAYVYKNQPYQIWVCNAFWSAPLIGTDSKAGTLIHEMSHFTVVADTDDHAYGQTAARNLANTNPTNAVDNADNHEYFAENTPFQN
jgi:peptidyl-Lys metalloendopeptidase